MTRTADLSDVFFEKLLLVCDRLGCKALDLLQVMASESGVTAAAHNANGDASGLIQFMPQTLANLGWIKGHEAFRKLSAEEQLPFVEKYFSPYKAYGLESPGRIYLFTFLPALGTKQGSRDNSYVLCASLGPLAWAYAANKVFDHDHKGFITLGDLTASCQRYAHGDRWDEIVSRLEEHSNKPLVTFNTWIDVQKELTRRGLYTGKIDGQPGPATLKGIAVILSP